MNTVAKRVGVLCRWHVLEAAVTVGFSLAEISVAA